ncbi:beta-1,3-glucanase family protein [Streptomyces carpaticus]|uniref:Beta-1,3-glucanase family protein n=1 Tax=Streptomyces carpaticus TaxID=285558 RepID=A0ABV4ZU74_9ACTN
MVNRRNLLKGAAAGALAVPAAGLLATRAFGGTDSAAPPAASAATLPVHIVNNTGEWANSSIHLYVVGNVDGRQVRLTPDGTLAPISLDDNGPDGFTEYAIPLAGSGTTTLQLPYMSGRIYTALGDKLKFKAVLDGNGVPALAYPAGWVTSDPNYEVLHDCAEFTYSADGMFCNVTMVDMFSVPLDIRLQGTADQTAGRLKDGGRRQIFTEAGRHEAFAPLVIGDRRVLAPSHGLDAGLFPTGYFDSYIDRIWADGHQLNIRTNEGYYTGRATGGRLVFNGPAEVIVDRPTTRDVLFCDGALHAPNDGIRGPVAAILGAALNRTTAHSHPEQPVTDAAAFYQHDVTHHYAKALHAAMVDGRAYGFAFDDVADFASYVQDHAPQQFTLTISPF